MGHTNLEETTGKCKSVNRCQEISIRLANYTSIVK